MASTTTRHHRPRTDADRIRRARQVRRTVIAGIVVVVVAFLVAILFTDDGDGPDDTLRQTGPVSIDGDALPPFVEPGQPDPAVGMTAPSVAGVTFSDRQVDLLQGAPTIAVFLAHWCNVCQAEVPVIVEHLGQTLPGDVRLVGIPTAVDAGQPNYPPSDWLERENWPFGLLLDSPTSEIGRAFGVPAYPAFVVLDADGTVKFRTTGALSPEQLDILVEIAQS
jgi:thiol-disulfide isomerase/thioredoxin